MNKIFKKKTDTLLIILFFFRNMLLLQTYKKPTTLQLKIMKKNRTKLRVRYGETDQMGVVYYGAYAEYLEQGRTEWLRELGFSYKWMEENNILLPVTQLHINYKLPARYDDVITITTELRKLPSVKIEFDYQIHNEENALLVTANTTLVFVDATTRKLRKAPDYLLEKLSS